MDIAALATALPWSSIAGAVAGAAPKLGGLLGTSFGGPLGGIAGSLAGQAIATAFGVAATPEAVGAAIARDPDAQAKLERLEAEHADALIQQAQVEIARVTQSGETDRLNVGAVNDTMRAELAVRTVDKNSSFFYSGWRPMAGHLLNLLTFLIGIAIVYAMFKGVFTGNNETLSLVLNSLVGISAFLAILGSVVGVTAWGRSYEQGKALTPPAEAPAAPAAPALPDVASIVRQTLKTIGKR